MAYFVGVKELRPYRTDYTLADDTDEYVENFESELFIDADQVDGVTWSKQGYSSDGSYGTVTSAPYNSYQAVRALQFATIQTGYVERLRDPDFQDLRGLVDYVGYGDVVPEKLGPGVVRLHRGYVRKDYTDWESVSYGEMEPHTWSELDGLVGSNQGQVRVDGGIATAGSVSPLGGATMVGHVRVSPAGPMSGPLLLEIVSGEDGIGDVVASSEHTLNSTGSTDIEVLYAPGTGVVASDPDSTSQTSYSDLEDLTYAQMESMTYGVLEAIPQDAPEPVGPETLSLRLRQTGGYSDQWYVNSMGLYDDPIAWSFSNDDGATWFEAVGVRNEPHGVLTFPVSDNHLRWRFEVFRPDASVTSLTIRPWYGSRGRTVAPTHDLQRIGANESTWDNLPSLDQHPMWRLRAERIDFEFLQPHEFPDFWRNLVPNPGGEGPLVGVTAVGGTVTSGGAP